MTPGFDYDRFDAAQALHWYCVDYHDGQWSELYSLQCALGYTPGCLEHGPEPDSSAAMLYDMLVEGSLDARHLFEWVKLTGAEER
jgi:hypothetical protein